MALCLRKKEDVLSKYREQVIRPKYSNFSCNYKLEAQLLKPLANGMVMGESISKKVDVRSV